MGTRPDTLAAALADSPAGLAAWLVDKYRDWSDNHEDLANSLDRDTLLTIITLYWVSDTIGSSFRQYVDFDHNTPRPAITVPAAFTVSTEPSMANFPREIAERACADIRHWSVEATARPLTGIEYDEAARSLRRKYPLLHGVLVPLMHRLGRSRSGRTVHFALVRER